MATGPVSVNQQEFLSQLKLELETFQQFQHTLTEEQAALIADEADRLIPLAERKNAFVAQLAQLANQRNLTLKTSVGSENQVGIEAWCKRFDPAGDLGGLKLWQALIETATQAKELNQLNGQLINTRLIHNQQALGVLLGANSVAENLYGKNGQAYTASNPSTGRPLGKA